MYSHQIQTLIFSDWVLQGNMKESGTTKIVRDFLITKDYRFKCFAYDGKRFEQILNKYTMFKF